MIKIIKYLFNSNIISLLAFPPLIVFASPQLNTEIIPAKLNAASKLPSNMLIFDFASIEFLIEQEVGRIVLKQIYKNIGITISITPLPGKRAQYVAETGIKDGEIMRIWTYGEENLNTIRVPTPYYYLETMPFVLKDSNIVISNKEELVNYRLTKIRGVKHTNNITKGLSKIYEMSTTEDMFTLLLNGKVDVVLTNTIDGSLAISKLGLEKVTMMKKPLARLSLYHYIHKKNKDLIPLINEEIIRMSNNGELAQLISIAEQQVIQKNQ